MSGLPGATHGKGAVCNPGFSVCIRHTVNMVSPVVIMAACKPAESPLAEGGEEKIECGVGVSRNGNRRADMRALHSYWLLRCWLPPYWLHVLLQSCQMLLMH